jgi:hypothetical protein
MNARKAIEKIKAMKLIWWAVDAHLDDDGSPQVALRSIATCGGHEAEIEGEEYAAWNTIRQILEQHGYSLDCVDGNRENGQQRSVANISGKKPL